MKTIEIYDPAMCCSTGVCGPSIDTNLLRVATTINTLAEKGITIKRFNLGSEPQAFIANKKINDLLQKEGAEVLPVTLVDGEVAKTKEYPTNEEFSTWLEIQIESNEPSEQGGCCCGSEGCC